MWMLERYYDEILGTVEDALRWQTQPVNVYEAAKWFFEKRVAEFPIVVPPFIDTWMEYKIPQAVQPMYGNADFMGCRAHYVRLDETERKAAIAEDSLYHIAYDDAAPIQTYPDDERSRVIEGVVNQGYEAGWAVIWLLFLGTKTKITKILQASATIDIEGGIIPGMLLFRSNLPPELHDELGLALDSFLFATSLMHAKNVSLVDDPLPAPIAKRRVKEGKPAITFKTLSIDPMRKQARNEASGTNGAKRAMHIVRGHFKDYRDGGGLFGKMNGLYWWDMHVAGDASVGTIVKDYKIAKVTP